jgi:hypothetical protein
MAGSAEARGATVRRLLQSLGDLGVETVYLVGEDSAGRIAEVVAREEADAVELFLVGRGGVPLLRELLRELTRVGRRAVSIVPHRVELISAGG